jgi:hypothetical protein
VPSSTVSLSSSLSQASLPQAAPARGWVPTPGNPLACLTTPMPQTQWPCGADSKGPCRGVRPIIELPDIIPNLNRLLQDWERVQNTIRPHNAIGYLTPTAFLHQLDTSHLIKNQEAYGR